MAFLDFIKYGNATQQTAANQSQKPETAKEMYTRQAAQEKPALKPLDQLPADQRAQVDAIKARLEKATQHIDKGAQAPAPADAGGSREAVRQNMTGQDKTAPALSPTSAQAGQPATEKSPQAKEPQEKAPARPQTLPRPRPSWER